MTPAEAMKEVQIQVEADVQETGRKTMARLPLAANALRNAELEVLSGNQSPSPSGRTAWKKEWCPQKLLGYEL